MANYTDDILSFVKDTARGMQMTSLINLLSDSSLITLDKLKKYENDFVALAKHSISKSDANWRCSDLIEVLGKIKTQKSFTAIRGYLNIKDAKRIRKDAVVALIKNNQTVNATVLNSMAADREIRLPLYSALKDIKKQSLFPKLYLTQKMLGESALYEAASDDYSIKAMKFVAEKTATYQGKKYKFYLFKVTLDEEEGSYLGVAGAYDIAGKFFEPKEDITSLHYEEEFDAAKVNEQFDAWLQSYAREDE